jgi:xanthine dehydrogenase molybdopterin-binding subunit B
MWYPIGFTVAANPSAAVVKVNEDGTATLLTGTVETGQGSLTILAQIVAQELGIATDDVHVVSADTDTTPMDTGAIASRTTYVTGNAGTAGGGKGQADPVRRGGAAAWRKAASARMHGPQDLRQGFPAAQRAHRRRPPSTRAA